MRRTVRLFLVVATLLVPAAAIAHDGGEADIEVPVGHVMPGQPFRLVAADFDPHSSVEISVLDGDHVERQVTVVAGDDGHFEIDLALPADHPHGAYELVAFSEYGLRATTWVLVGSPGEAPGQVGAPGGDSGGPALDPSLLVLGLLIGGAGAGLLLLLLRPTPRRSQPRQGGSGRRR
jgi:hypothetical protein